MQKIAAVVFAGTFLALAAFTVMPASADDAKGDGDYQIIRATEDRVWRLNKKTGEIAVCTLDGDSLVCTTSTDAATPPSMTYEERQAENERAVEDAEKERLAQQARDLEFLDRAVAAFKLLIGAAQERGDTY